MRRSLSFLRRELSIAKIWHPMLSEFFACPKSLVFVLRKSIFAARFNYSMQNDLNKLLPKELGSWFNTKSLSINISLCCIIELTFSTFNELLVKISSISSLRLLKLDCNEALRLLWGSVYTANSSECFISLKSINRIYASCILNSLRIVLRYRWHWQSSKRIV